MNDVNAIVTDESKRTASVEALIQAGKRKLDKQRAEREAEDLRRAMERQAGNRKFWQVFRGQMGEYIPEELLPFVNFPPEHAEPDYWPELFLTAPGCLPIWIKLNLRGMTQEEGVSVLHLKEKPAYIVAGVRTTEPGEDDGELCQGMVEIVWSSSHWVCDPNYYPTTIQEMDLALALAAERGEYFSQQVGKVKALEAEIAADIVQRPPAPVEPVYAATDEERSTGLVNMAEVVRLVKDLVEEALQERGI